jgi:hypothetical protein
MDGELNGDLASAKVHVAHDGVWLGLYNYAPARVADDVPAFLLGPHSDLLHYRIIGCQANVPLILGLYARRLARNRGLIEVCSPRSVVPQSFLRNGPESLSAARQDAAMGPPSMGGFHVFDKRDYHSYALAHLVQKGIGCSTEFLNLVRLHAAWPACSFVPTLDPHAFGKLLGCILDPRWFVDPMAPNRGSCLRSYLGLHPHIMDDVLAGRIRGPKAERCQLVLRCWRQVGAKQNLEDAGNFLYRIAVSHTDDGAKGLLRASQVFCDLLRLSWVATLSGKPELFLPEYFFRPGELPAFQRHILTEGHHAAGH